MHCYHFGFLTPNKMNNGNLMLVICGIALILSGIVLECYYAKKVKQIERNCHYNLVNDGETGSNSVYIGWKCECGSTKINVTVKDKPFCFLCGKDVQAE